MKPLVFILGFWFVLDSQIPARAHDIPNQRVDRSMQVTLRPSQLRIDYEVGLSELTLTQDLRSLIGSLPGADRREWLEQFGRVTGPLNAKGFFVTVDRRPVEIEYKSFDLVVEEHPRYTFHLEAAIPRSGRLEIYDTNYATSEGTSRLAIRARDGAGFTGDSLPHEVSEIPIRPVWELSDEEELRSKRVVVTYSSANDATSPGIAPRRGDSATADVRPTAAPPSEPSAPGNGGSGSRFVIHLRDFLDRDRGMSMPGILLVAGILGAVHSLQPGHGKSLVSAAALRRGSRWYHPMILGLVTSLTHTGSVLLVAWAIWMTGTSRVEDLHSILIRGAGFVIGMAGFWRMGRFLGGHDDHSDETRQHALKTPGTLELVGLGFSGGLVPCWEAVGLIILAAAIGRLTLGVLCVIAFGAGMAAVLMSVGFLASRFWSAILAKSAAPRLERWLGVGTSLLLATVGLTLFFE